MARLVLALLLAVTLVSCGSTHTETMLTQVATTPAAGVPAAGAPAANRVPVPAPAVPSEGPARSFSAGETLPTASLQVATDGCGVIRSQFSAGPPHGLQWSVADAEGFEVLGRNALGETHYRYFQSGSYTVVLKAWGGESYVPVSNAVSISC